MSNSKLINEMQEMAILHLEKFFLEVQELKGTGDDALRDMYDNHLNGLIIGWKVIGLDQEHIVAKAMEIIKK